MKMSETIEFILKNKNSLNPAVLETVLGSIEPDTTEEEETEPAEPTEPTEPAESTPEPTEQNPQ